MLSTLILSSLKDLVEIWFERRRSRQGLKKKIAEENCFTQQKGNYSAAKNVDPIESTC
jgi:hypothetical protein